jgi:prepilin-type N-terminal cleavage/methylation domain-containing protein
MLDSHRRRRSAFTLIELLVVIAIIAILAVVVILTLNPAQMLAQSRDANRVSDMSTLNNALNFYNTDQSGVASFSLGSSGAVYVSLPDPAATSTTGTNCGGMGLLTLPSAYTYHCAPVTSDRSINGTGWIPVNFSLITSGSPIGTLPLDPTNQSSSRLYYSYAAAGTQFEVTMAMESAKYKLSGSGDVVSTDGGLKPGILEKGTNFTLEPLAYADNSLALYWTMDEGTGTVAYDYSGNNASGSWSGTAAGTSGHYSAGKVGSYAGAFASSSVNYISTGYTYSLTSASNFTWSGWMDVATSGTVNTTIIGNRYSSGGTWAKITPSGFEYGSGMVTPYVLPLNAWEFVTVTKSGSAFLYYLNGALVSSGTSAASITNEPFYVGGDPNFVSDGYITGLVDDVRLYTRALSATEIRAIYVSQH